MPSSAFISAATLEVSLPAILENYRILSSKLSSGRCGAAVKANAYGLGIEEVAPVLAEAGCRDFFVATLEEGIQLRGLLKDASVYVINGAGAGEDRDFTAHGLIPVLNSPEQIAYWATHGQGPSVLHVDTGMNRLGLSQRQLEELDASVSAKARIGMVMSHLACADEPKHPLNKEQLERFKAALKIPAFAGMTKSLANSSGIYLGKPYHYDLARPGCALYGINPTPDKKNPMKAVAMLSAPLLQIREIARRESIGYDATYFAKKGDRIATIGIGYADGFFRSLSSPPYIPPASGGERGGAHGHIGNVRVPVVGRISMDLIMVDVTKVPASLLARNPRVEFIGPHQSVDAFADAAGTIGYEVFTRLGRRVKRVYIE